MLQEDIPVLPDGVENVRIVAKKLGVIYRVMLGKVQIRSVYCGNLE